mgnify:CR=1 FL=1
MTRDGLTFTMVFLAESANYGEGIGNITTLKKMTRGDFQQYSYISRQAMRYNIVKQLKWDNTPVDGKSGVVQFAPSATIEDYPEIDLFGYMKTTSKADDKKGGASTRSAVVRLSNAISLEPYQSDLEFLTNMGLAQRQNLENGIAQSEIHRSYYSYTISIDLDRIGVDVEIEVSQEEKASRVKELLDTVQYLYRDHVGPQRAAVGKVQPQAVGLAHDGGGRFAGMHPHAEGDNLLPEHRRPRSEERRVGKECRSRWSPYH